ncbi:MAG: class I SAM-dependent methyltransferase [Tissierellia bacterium]|nr:class I SAM-dependent methyltransferase [Tissierellia bacterium]
MPKEKSEFLFNAIAPIYGLFYDWQKKGFVKVIEEMKPHIDIGAYGSVLDVGCGTGALCSVLNEMGLSVTGIDPAVKMLNIAKGKPENQGVRFEVGNVLEGLPYPDDAFDLSISSFVAHGLVQSEREKMYAEMSRVTKSKVIIYDYNENRGLLTTIVEWAEGGDYFNFIKSTPKEMELCFTGLKRCFSQVQVVHTGKRGAWYICTPSKG